MNLVLSSNVSNKAKYSKEILIIFVSIKKEAFANKKSVLFNLIYSQCPSLHSRLS